MSSTAETRRASRSHGEERVVGIPVRSVMTSVPTALSASTPLDAAVKNVLSRHPDTDMPVVDGGRVTGVASMRDVQSLGLTANQGVGLTVADVARPVSTFVIDPDADISSAYELLAKRGIDLLLVFQNEYLLGTVSPADLAERRDWTNDSAPADQNRF